MHNCLHTQNDWGMWSSILKKNSTFQESPNMLLWIIIIQRIKINTHSTLKLQWCSVNTEWVSAGMRWFWPYCLSLWLLLRTTVRAWEIQVVEHIGHSPDYFFCKNINSLLLNFPVATCLFSSQEEKVENENGLVTWVSSCVNSGWPGTLSTVR